MRTEKITSLGLGEEDCKQVTLVTCGNCWDEIVVRTISKGDELAKLLTEDGWNAVTTQHEFIPNCCPTCVRSLLAEHSPH